MINAQLILILPFIALLSVLWLSKFPAVQNKLSGKISILFSILFLVGSLAVLSLKQPILLNFLSITKGLNFSWILGLNNFLFLLLIGWFWLALEIYATQYFLKTGDKKINKFRILFLAVISVLTPLILSQNLLSALLCYQLLVLVLCFFVSEFIPKASAKSAKNFSIFILSSATFLPLAAALTFKITGNLNFTETGVITSQIELWQYSLLFCFYAFSLALIAFVPAYLLFSNLYYLSPPVMIATLPAFGIGVLALLFKVVFYIFGQKTFISFAGNVDYSHLFTIILALNLLASAVLAIFSKNLKQILTFLFFNQLIFVIFEFLNFALSPRQMQISIISFVLSQMLIFLAIGNISIYLKESEHKNLNGIFYKLRITILGLSAALLNIVGFFPGVGMVEKYWLFRQIIGNNLTIEGVVVCANLFLVAAIIIKIILPMIEISTKKSSEQDYQIAKDIETDLSLVMPIFIGSLFLIATIFLKINL